jgi:hypothetical protein
MRRALRPWTTDVAGSRPGCTSAPASDPGSDREQHTASHYQQISSEREKRMRIQASNPHSIARKAG